MYHCSQLLYEKIVVHENLVGENMENRYKLNCKTNLILSPLIQIKNGPKLQNSSFASTFCSISCSRNKLEMNPLLRFSSFYTASAHGLAFEELVSSSMNRANAHHLLR